MSETPDNTTLTPEVTPELVQPTPEVTPEATPEVTPELVQPTPEVTPELVEITGLTGPIGPITEPIPDILRLDDLMNDHSLIVTKESADKILLDSIGGQTVAYLRPKLLEWVSRGLPSAYPILSLNIQPPTKCSDGESRDLTDYVTFCSGKTIHEHVAILQAKLPDINVSFGNFSGAVTIVVSKD